MADKYLGFNQDGVKYNLYDMPDGFVIKGNLILSYKNLTELPDLSKIIVEGNFYCRGNQLTSLKGAPQKVGGDFWCSENQLTSLQGAPQEVGGDFDCSHNNLTSLKGAPQKVGGDFTCDNNRQTSLNGISKEINGYIVADEDVLAKYGFNDTDSIKFNDLQKSSLYREENVDVTIQKLRRKVMRTIAAENVSPQKGVVNPKRTNAEKKAIKKMLDGIGKSISTSER